MRWLCETRQGRQLRQQLERSLWSKRRAGRSIETLLLSAISLPASFDPPVSISILALTDQCSSSSCGQEPLQTSPLCLIDHAPSFIGPRQPCETHFPGPASRSSSPRLSAFILVITLNNVLRAFSSFLVPFLAFREFGQSRSCFHNDTRSGMPLAIGAFFMIWEGCLCFQMIPREHDYRRFIYSPFLQTFWFSLLLWLFGFHFFLAGSKDIALYLNHTFMLD